MKRHLARMATGCLVGLALTGVTATVAQAIPPTFLSLFECQTLNNKASYWKTKMLVSEGNNCLGYDSTRKSDFEPVPTTGHTPEPSEKVPFTSTSGPSSFTTPEGLTVECSTTQMSGEFLGSERVPTSIKYAGCEMPLVGECTSPGQLKGVIQTKQLVGFLFAIKEEPKEAGLFLTLNSTLGGTFAEYECGLGTKVVVLEITKEEGEVLNDKKSHSCLAGRFEPVNKVVGEGKTGFVKEGTKQAIKVVKYNGHEFECELEAETTIGLIKTLERQAYEGGAGGNPLFPEEPWELMM